MLKKRTRSHQKSQQNMGQLHHVILDSHDFWHANSDIFLNQKQKSTSFFALPGLFVRLNPKTPESDSIRSPTSPLDFKIFSKPKKSNEESQKSWDCNKVGLSIIESLENDTKTSSRKVIRSFDSKNMVFAPQMRILNNPCLKSTHFDHFESTSNSLPKNYPILAHTHIKKSNPQMINSFEQDPFAKTLSCSLDSTKPSSNLSSLTFCLSKEIELSEDYTCVRKHGVNPKTTHIFGDCILECDDDNFVTKSIEKEQETSSFEVMNSNPFDDFLSHCYTCKKMLEGEDIYMYRGEKAFCSLNCRSEEILIEEEKEKTNTKLEPKPNNCEEIFETSMFIAP